MKTHPTQPAGLRMRPEPRAFLISLKDAGNASVRRALALGRGRRKLEVR